MQLRQILYVSRSLLTIPGDEAVVAGIVDWSRAWNAGAGITGALMFTEVNFAQFIEGPPEPVAHLFANLNRDARHTDLTVISDTTGGGARRFANWTLTYSGPEFFLEQRYLQLLQAAQQGHEPGSAEDIIGLMQAFADIGVDRSAPRRRDARG